MILKTIETLTKYNKYKHVYEIYKFIIINKLIIYYRKNLDKENLSELLKDLVYCCAFYGIDGYSDDDTTFGYKINDTNSDDININITFKGDKLDLSLHNCGILNYYFVTDKHFHDGVYQNCCFDLNCDDILKYQIESLLKNVISKVLFFTLNQTNKYIK